MRGYMHKGKHGEGQGQRRLKGSYRPPPKGEYINKKNRPGDGHVAVVQFNR